MPSLCMVVGCGSRSGTKKGVNVRFFRLPSITTRGGKFSYLSMERRDLWIRSLKRIDISDSQLKYGRICSKHFMSGKPADLSDKNHPDWVPSINMDLIPSRNRIKKTRRLAMMGSICNFCEKLVCQSRKCLQTHAYNCPAICIKCNKGVRDHGGKLFKCSSCKGIICEDDQYQHKASCQDVKSKNYKCQSCHILGQYSCSRCKSCFCNDHVKTEGFKYKQNEALPCPKCGYETLPTKNLSSSNHRHKFKKPAQAGIDNDHNYHAPYYIHYPHE